MSGIQVFNRQTPWIDKTDLWVWGDQGGWDSIGGRIWERISETCGESSWGFIPMKKLPTIGERTTWKNWREKTPGVPTGLGNMPVSTSQTRKHTNSWSISRLFRWDLPQWCGKFSFVLYRTLISTNKYQKQDLKRLWLFSYDLTLPQNKAQEYLLFILTQNI